MTTTNFDFAFQYVIGNEGTTFTNDPVDAGGATKYGITKRTYESFFNRVVHISEIQNMTEDIAKQIYKALYWAHLQCDQMVNKDVATCVFDTGVLYGTVTSVTMAQESLNLCGFKLKTDGAIGPQTLGALNLVVAPNFIRVFHGLVIQRIDRIVAAVPKDRRFQKGWTVRADRLLTLLS